MEKISRMINRHWGVVSYLIFGVLTTLVNFLVYYLLYNLLFCTAALCNAFAWIVAVLFAFLTNKPFVFKSYDWSCKVVLSELFRFVSCRMVSGLLETAAIWLFVDIICWNGNLIKIFVSLIVILLNYIFSKWVVFYKN